MPGAAVLDGDERDPVERQLVDGPRRVLDVLPCRRLHDTRRGGVFARLDLPQLSIREHELAFEHHEALGAAAVDARVEHAPPLDGAGTHEDHRRREAAVDRHRWRQAALVAAGAGVHVERRDLDALNHHDALAVVERSGLHGWIRPLRAGHRPVDRVVDISFDDEEAGEPAGDLIVCRAMAVRVIPVRAWRMGLARATAPGS